MIAKSRDFRIGGYGVTTCIAAMVNPFWHGDDKGPFIVVASDTLLSFGGYCSMEGMTKNKNFHRDWSAMIAGNDISQSLPVIERATEMLRGRTGKANVVRRAFKKAYAEYRREVITDTFLTSFDMTFPEFKRKGKKQLNPEIHADLSFLIKNFNLGCTFLVYGFDDEGEPHILTVSNPGKAEVYDKPGFWAIGSGKTAAISMLAALGQHPERHSLHETIYNVLAAKYISEGAPDVGKETWMFINKPGCSAFMHEPKMEERVREIWEKEGRPKTNSEAVKVLHEAGIKFLPIPRGPRAVKRLALRKLKDQQ
jgi:20S proteasome alpha/beta subunit